MSLTSPIVSPKPVLFRLRHRIREVSSPAVRCTDLAKRYGAVVAVDGLSLAVERGECFGLLGPNGAGKTTTIEILEGLLTPDAGQVEVLGLSWASHERALRQRLGIQLQETQLTDKLTVEETVRLFRSFYHQGPDVAALVELVGLSSKGPARSSTCRAARSSGCRSPARSPASPTCCSWTSPRPGSIRSRGASCGTCWARSAQKGGTVLLTTHYMDEAEALCDRVAIVDHGRIIAQDTPRR